MKLADRARLALRSLPALRGLVGAVTNSGYGQYGASRGRKSLIGWLFNGGSPDEDIVEHIDVLRQRARDLYMGTPLATGALDTLVTNAVGPGLKLSAQIDADFLGLTDEQADEWERNVEREFGLWADSPACDATRMCNFGQLQALALLSTLMSGDVFAVLPMMKRRGTIYDLRVHLIEADRVCDPTIVDSKLNILGGVEVGSYGEPVAYYVTRYHPLASVSYRTLANDWKRVPAYGTASGRRNILHLMVHQRPEQRRGVPVLAPVIESLKQLGRYHDAELQAAVVSAMLTVFITSAGTTADASTLGQSIDPDERVDTADLNSVELGNGAVVGLAPGESVNAVNPGRPNPAFDQFVRAICVPIGSALGIPYELLLKHFTSSYTAARAAFLEFWKTVKTRRAWLAAGFCQPIYDEWLAEAVARGRVSCPGFFDDLAVRAAWSSAEWHGPAQGQINEKVEAAAANDRVQFGFSTMTQETAGLTGGNWDQVNRARRREMAKQVSGGPSTDNPDDPTQAKPENLQRAARMLASANEANSMAARLLQE